MRQSKPLLLDVTRLVSRLPRASLTGIDRVERAYLDHCLAHHPEARFLLRTGFGYMLLDARGGAEIAALIDAPKPLAAASLVSRLAWHRHPDRAQVESHLRKVSVARCRSGRLGAMLRRAFPTGGVYLNTGHSTLTRTTFIGLKRAGLKAWILIHDVLPLTHPQFTRAGRDAVFARKLRRVARYADLVIHPNATTRAETERALAAMGRVPPGLIAPLGITVAVPKPEDLSPELMTLTAPFLHVGTIEPRKNIALLLDVWDGFMATLPSDQIPPLVLVGGRGWSSAEVLRRLDTHPLNGTKIFEARGLSDGALCALYTRAAALLFPSMAEGTGLPPFEAAALGCPLILSDLPVYHETLGDIPVYLDPVDMYSWTTIINKIRSNAVTDLRAGMMIPPTWAEHFDNVFQTG